MMKLWFHKFQQKRQGTSMKCCLMISILLRLLFASDSEDKQIQHALKEKQEKADQTFYQDILSHSIKAVLPNSTEVLILKTPEFDAKKAQWRRGVSMAASRIVEDGDLILVRYQKRNYIIKVINQQMDPEFVKYSWMEYGQERINQGDGKNFDFGDFVVPWSGYKKGFGYIYCDIFLDKQPIYELGSVYFKKNNFSDISSLDIQNLRFSPYPWEIK